jgi:hypothetical protein
MKPIPGILVVFTVFINDAQILVRLWVGVEDDRVDFEQFRRGFIARVFDADSKVMILFMIEAA